MVSHTQRTPHYGSFCCKVFNPTGKLTPRNLPLGDSFLVYLHFDIATRKVWSNLEPNQYKYDMFCALPPNSRRWSPSGHLRSVPGHQGVGGRRRNPFHHSVGAATDPVRHSVAAAQRARRDRQQGSAEREHHTAHPVPAEARPVAQDLHHSRRRLRRTSVAVHHHRSAEGRRRPVWCRRIDYAARGEFGTKHIYILRNVY